MNSIRTLAPLACLLGAALLTGCASTPFGAAAKTPSSPTHTDSAAPAAAATNAPAPAQSGLKEGIALYNNGDYNDAIKRLAAADVTGGSKATQLEALKYTAFSYCLTSRQTLCRQQFEKALKLDPSFDLEVGEHGHPLWGPVFTKAKKSK
jgi:Flp pilus assembly protein TadD